MDYKLFVEKYKDQPIFKVVLVVIIIVCVVKIAMFGYEFVHWLKVK